MEKMIERFLESKTVLRLVSLAVVVYLIMIVLSDFEVLISITVPIVFIMGFLGLAFANYLLRAIKWHFYSRELGVEISFKRNVLVFLSGLSMTITPARMGEVLKCYLLKKFSGVKISSTLSAVVVERLTDIIALCLLALTGIFINSSYALIAVVFSVGVLVLLYLTRVESVYRVLAKLPVVKRFVSQISDIQKSSTVLATNRNVAVSLAITVPAWFLECVGLWLLLLGLGVQIPVGTAVFIFSFSSVFGALSMLPGGIGAAEASFAVLLTQLVGLSLTAAVWVTIVTRLCTVWFGTVIGVVSLASTERLKKDQV
jgi:uncharacterized protein (TIRG00374 family)